jgi:8-oxo-dGTP pyrophosphatase MutT (NUDIX family)
MVAELVDEIAFTLSQPCDVRGAWSSFAPELTYGRHSMPPPPHARCAAVLVLLYVDDGDLRLPLIERTTDHSVHSGQVSFPGGAMEREESPESAALRELEEELGVTAAAIQLCGRLTPMYIYASNFLVTPCVAVTSSRPEFRLNPAEVASLLEVPVRCLRDPSIRGCHEVCRRGLVFRAPHFEFLGRRIWGATSMMLAELLTRLPESFYYCEPVSRGRVRSAAPGGKEKKGS